MLKALNANDGVAILIDQHIQAPDAVTVHFFDRPAATTLAVGVLALRTGAPVIPVFALPNGAGRYRLVFHVGDHYRGAGVALPDPPFVDVVPVEFGIAEDRGSYHVPLVCTPWAYSTYRGS